MDMRLAVVSHLASRTGLVVPCWARRRQKHERKQKKREIHCASVAPQSCQILEKHLSGKDSLFDAAVTHMDDTVVLADR
jgi:hypothetical protein